MNPSLPTPDLTLPKMVCAWCSTLMRDGVHPISHGLCELCRAKLEKDSA